MTAPHSFEDFTVGQSAALDRVIGADDVARFVELTGDDNPVHTNAGFAAGIGLGDRVVHGMLTASYVSTVIGTMLPGPGALWLSERFRFRAPVRVDDHIRAEVTIRHISPATRVLVLDVVVTNQHGRVVLDGDAQVHVLARLDDVSGVRGTTGTVIVTGAGRGIGAAIAQRLAEDNMSVVVNFRSDRARAAATVSAIQDAGGHASAFQADVTDPDAVEALIAYASEQHGPIEALVNNAGGPTNPRPINETSWEEMHGHLQTHLGGGFLCVQAVLPGMVERGFGRIVNITSQSAYGTPPTKMSGYVVAKAALAAFTRCLAVEAGPHGVTANAVAPGMIDTELVSEIPQRTKLALAAQAPLRRLATVSDVADVVAYLLGPGGSYVTGQTIHLSGGQAMA